MDSAWTAVKAGYGKAVAWIDNHPQMTLWLAASALIALLVLA